VSAILLLSNGIPVAAVVQSTEGAHVGMSRFTVRGPTLKSIRICQPRLRSFTFPTHSSRRLPAPVPPVPRRPTIGRPTNAPHGMLGNQPMEVTQWSA
jgi:hypothetical protein